jgi:hypothetical protein
MMAVCMGSSPGAIAANFYHGARSEYLAQYVFYSVQVNSAPGPWVFDGPRAVGDSWGIPLRCCSASWTSAPPSCPSTH